MKAAKTLKVVLAAAMLALVTAAFFGAPTSFACRIQPGPTIAFLVVLLLTPLVGRFFCECLCPLGILQSFVNWVFHPRTKVRRVCTRLPESRAQLGVRNAVLTAAIVWIASGLGGIGWTLTPYSIYGKALTLFMPGVALFAVVIVLAAIGKGRIWCNWICPVGTIFSLLSKKTLCPHKVGKGCANCKACFAAASAAEPPSRQTDEPQNHQTDITRRDTLKGIAVIAAADAVEKTTDGGFAAVSLPGDPMRYVAPLPPGAIDAKVFYSQCVGCGLCIAKCKGNCLSASTGVKHFGQPEMDFKRGYCLVGCNYSCGQVCPTGAIGKIQGLDRKNVHMGHAVWEKDRCIRTTDDVKCTACARKCPVGAIHIIEGFPVVNREECIGCGACEHVCPARPKPAIYVQGFERQRIVWPMGEGELLAEMKSLVESDGGPSLSYVAARHGVIVDRQTGTLKSLLSMLDAGSLADSIVVAQVIGRADAAVCIAGKAKKVHACNMRDTAMEFLKAHGVEASADRIVPRIPGNDIDSDSPDELAVEGINDPVEMVKALKSRT